VGRGGGDSVGRGGDDSVGRRRRVVPASGLRWTAAGGRWSTFALQEKEFVDQPRANGAKGGPWSTIDLQEKEFVDQRSPDDGGGVKYLRPMPYNAALGPTTYVPSADRYDSMEYRRCGRSGLKLPAISLGLWQNFGDDRPLANSRAILRRAFDLGITHFDLANNYGPPYGSAEINFGRVFAEDFGGLRDEVVISTKAGYDMWPGPYGEWGSRKYLLGSLDQSLARMRLDYVDIFYSHRLDPETPLEETMGALADAVRSGKARYVGISSYGPERTEEAVRILQSMGIRLLIHQPSYSLLNRWIENGLLDVLEREGVGAIVFSPLGQGLLTDRYLNGIPADSRVRAGNYLSEGLLNEENLARVRALNEIAVRRGQTLAQLAIAWALRDKRVTSALLGASSVEQLDQNVAALDRLDFDDAELAEIDRYAVDGAINLWEQSSSS
jgi:L-glyceraldehyde 3-phosphate reductase